MSVQPEPPPRGEEMHSHPVGRVAFDSERLAGDIEVIEGFQMSGAYSEYAKGEWNTCMLLNETGDKDDGLSAEYEGHAVPTEYGLRVPYLNEVIRGLFKLEHLKSARIFSARRGFIIPHRDYLEFKKGFTRIHVVLRTNDRAMNSEGSTVYRMREGEIWFLDGRYAHSGGSFADERRLHMVLDFDPEVPIKDLFNNPADYRPGLTPCLVQRQAISEQERESLVASLGGFLTDLNYDSVFEFVAKLHFDRVMDCAATYDVMREIASRSGDPRLAERAEAEKRYFLGNLRKAG
jgi:hypothetical protein